MSIISLIPAQPGGTADHQGRPCRLDAWGLTADGTVVALVRQGDHLVQADGDTERPASPDIQAGPV